MYYKPGYEQAWVQRSTKAVEDMIQDPFWVDKQSSESSNDAILIQCGTGFVERTIDGGQNWINVTPDTNPPNTAGDSPAPIAQGVVYTQLDGSYSIQDEFVCLATWQNAGGAWRTWLYYTDDSFATTGVWTALDVTSGYDLGSFNTSQEVYGGPPGYENPSMMRAFSVFSSNNIVRLSDTKMVICFLEDTGGDPFLPGYLMVIDIQPDGSLSMGARQGPWMYDGVNGENEVHGHQCFYWDSQTVIIISYEHDYEFNANGGDKNFFAQLVSISGTTATFGTTIELFGDYGSGTFIPNHWDFKKLPGVDYGIMVTNPYSGYYNDAGLARIIQKTGALTLTKGSSYYTFVPNDDPGSAGHCVVAHTSTTAVIFYTTSKVVDGSPYRTYAVPVTISGLTMSFGSTQEVAGGSGFGYLQGIRLTDTKGVFVRDHDVGDGQLVCRVYSFSGGVITIEALEIIVQEDIFWNFNVHAIDSTKWAVFWGVGSEYGAFTRICYLTSTYDFSMGTVAEVDDGSYDEIAPFGRWASADRLIMVYHHDDGGTLYWIRGATIDIPSSDEYQVRGLGVSIGKGAGNRAWLTVWAFNQLILVDIDIATLTVSAEYSLGFVSAAELAAGTYYAYPFAGWGDDDWVVVYGRMNDPYSWGSPTYAIESDDGGATAVLVPVDGTWTSGGCSALWVEVDGMMYAIRNLGTSSKLYYGNAVVDLNLMSTLPFPAGVNPHAIKVDPYDLSVYAGADIAQPIMLVKSFPLYTAWKDMTYDHDTSTAINSVELL